MQSDAIFAALADPTRLAIVARLAEEGEVDATELARPFEISQPSVSRHIRVLEEAGWITRRRIGSRRPLRLSPERLAEVHRWSGGLIARMEARYARLEQLLAEQEAPHDVDP